MGALARSDDVPSLRDEIDRKSFETLERLALQLERGEITPAQFDAAVFAVWNCVSGLVSKPIMEAISEIESDHAKSSFKDCRIFVKKTDGKLTSMMVSRVVGKGKTVMMNLNTGDLRVFDYDDMTVPQREAMAMQDKLSRKLLDSGYKQL